MQGTVGDETEGGTEGQREVVGGDEVLVKLPRD